MTTRFTAIVELGMLRPILPVALKDGTEVEVIVFQADNGHSPTAAAEILAEIAAIPMEPHPKALDDAAVVP